MGPWTALGARPNAICFVNNSILLFPYLSDIPCQPPSFFLPRGAIPPAARPRAGRLQEPQADAATSRCHVFAASRPAPAWAPGKGGAGRCGEAGSAREQRGRDPMRSADGGGGGAVRAEGRGQEAVAGEPGRPRRQSLLRLSHPGGNLVGAPLTSNPRRSPHRLVCAPDLASRSPLALRTGPPASCAVRGRGRGACCRVVLGCGAGAAEA